MRTADLVDLVANDNMGTPPGEGERADGTQLPPLLRSLLQDGMEVCRRMKRMAPAYRAR